MLKLKAAAPAYLLCGASWPVTNSSPAQGQKEPILPTYQVSFSAERYIATTKHMSSNVAWVHLAYNEVETELMNIFSYWKCSDICAHVSVSSVSKLFLLKLTQVIIQAYAAARCTAKTTQDIPDLRNSH